MDQFAVHAAVTRAFRVTVALARTSIICCLLLVMSGILSRTRATEVMPSLIGIQYGSEDLDAAQKLDTLHHLGLRRDQQNGCGREWGARTFETIETSSTGGVQFIVEPDQHALVEIDGRTPLDTKSGLMKNPGNMIEDQDCSTTLIYFKDGRAFDCRPLMNWAWGGESCAAVAGRHWWQSAQDVAKTRQLFRVAKDGAAAENDQSEDDVDRPIDRPTQGIVFRKRAGKLEIEIDGKSFATYVWSDPATTRPYFKNVCSLGGDAQLTRHHPPKAGDFQDHATYHPGIWWGFGDVGGNDYWRMQAKVIGGSFLEKPRGGQDQGGFAVRNRMLTKDGQETFCLQDCYYRVLKRPAGVLLICDSRLTRQQGNFWLGDQEEMGIGIRMATSIAVQSQMGGEIRDGEGRTDLQQIRTNQSDWCDYSGPVAGKQGGILLMNDPQNFRKPWWHAVNNGLLVANPLGESELSGRGKRRQNVLVKHGETFRLRYGVLVHAHANQENFDPARAYEDFLALLPKLDHTTPAIQ